MYIAEYTFKIRLAQAVAQEPLVKLAQSTDPDVQVHHSDMYSGFNYMYMCFNMICVIAELFEDTQFNG